MKTACEEAADKFEAAAEWLDVPALDDFSGLPKRLRAEGRELRRLRKMFAAGITVDRGIGFRGVLAQNRIEKARKK